MAPIPKLLIGTTLTAFLVGCYSDPGKPVGIIRPPAKKTVVKSKPDILKLDDHLIGVATVSDRDAILAQQCLDKNKIPYGTFVDISSTGIVVKEPDAERARRLIREDSWNRGYKLLERIPPTPEPNRLSLHGPTSGQAEPTKPADPPTVPKPASIQPMTTKPSGKMITVAAVAPKDVKTVLACLTANGIKAPGTWQSLGTSGIVVASEIAPQVLKLIQDDAKKHNYRLLNPTAREPISGQSDGPPPSKEDLSAQASLILFVREQDESFVSECLEAHSISSAASCDLGSSAVYVSEYDADRALALIQDNSRTRGYSFTSKRVNTKRG